MKIPFDIKYKPQIESGEYKVETRGGRPARIICWDAVIFSSPSKKPKGIIALVKDEDGVEEVFHYFDNGKPWLDDTLADLFIVTPEPELNPFEQSIKDRFFFGELAIEESEIKEIAAELLSLARKQLQPEIDAEIEKAYKTADEVQYRKGREEALKDLPRWKKVGLNTGQTTLVIGYTGEEDKLYRNGYVISLPDLEKLPKEDE